MTLAAPGLRTADAAFRDAKRGADGLRERIAAVIAKIEMSLAHMRFAETSHGG